MENKTPEQVKQQAQRLINEAPMRWVEATATILVVVGVFAFLGKFLDNQFSTSPWLFIGGIVIAFPISQYIIYKRLKNRFKL